MLPQAVLDDSEKKPQSASSLWKQFKSPQTTKNNTISNLF